MNWHFYIDSAEEIALKLCRGSMIEGSGYNPCHDSCGYGWGYGDVCGGGRGYGYGRPAGDGYGWGNGSGSSGVVWK